MENKELKNILIELKNTKVFIIAQTQIMKSLLFEIQQIKREMKNG